MALKKSELYSSLWASCDELRGGMDASQYKDYVLVLLFVKYVSDKFKGQVYAEIKVPEGASFSDMVKLKGTPNIGDDINKKILAPLEFENKLSGMPDFNDATKLGHGKEMVDRLTNLISIFENPALDFTQNRADGDDLLGDAYEYLMRHFATESGKSKGQFYTPAEVSRVIAQILGIRNAKTTASTTVYDPTCGSGSLLLKVGVEAARGSDVQITLFGQEKDSSTAGLARMNMILHGYASAEINQGNTIANPMFLDGEGLKTFDYVVANPPFSDKRWSSGIDPENDLYQRFADGVPPAKQGDYAYLLHIMRSLKQSGSGACILPHGVLFRGNAEAVIRRKLIERGYIKAIIGMPANLFYGTGIPACILILDKSQAASREGIFMIDASKGFIKDGNKNRLREQDIHRIVDTFNNQYDVLGYSRMVPVSEISDAKNDCNLNLPRYIDSGDAEDLHDIMAHMRGGIPERDIDALADYWSVMPSLRASLFESTAHAGYAQLRVPISSVKATIFDHLEFASFNQSSQQLFTSWSDKTKPLLNRFDQGDNPKALIETISEDLLKSFVGARLMSIYDLYQHLMDYWAESMQDDCYLVSGDGWDAAAKPKLIVEERGNKNKTVTGPDLVVGKRKYQTELIAPELIITRYFADQQSEIDQLNDQIAAFDQQLEEMAEEHGGEDGLLEEAKTDKDKITKASVTARLKAIRGESDAAEERAALQAYLDIVNKQSDAGDKLKAADVALNEAVLAQYGKLTKQDIITLVVDDKWLATLSASVQGELDRVSQTLTSRIREMAERYATPLPTLISEVSELSNRVDQHLKRMVSSWQ